MAIREIIFRGKRVDDGEWVEGFYYKQLECYGDTAERDCIITSKEVLSYDQALCWEEVIPETVGQYTDLTDKNGIRIFEGDVIRAYSEIGGYDFTAEVEWGNFIKGWHCGKYRPMYDGFNNEYEVMGNKWDNPELLGGDKE